jgi:hypothetical protein
MFGFDDQSDQPLLPPGEVRIQEVQIEPWTGSRRVKVLATLTPFEQRPNLDLSIQNQAGEVVASVSIVEVLEPKFVITMHIRGDDEEEHFTLLGSLYYPDQEPVHRVSIPFDLPTEDRDPAVP